MLIPARQVQTVPATASTCLGVWVCLECRNSITERFWVSSHGACMMRVSVHLQDVSIVMKGETVPCGAVWRGVPAVPVMDHV
jgi:hypothetical protein